MKQIAGGVTAPNGFFATGVEANIKYANRKDMAMIYSKAPCKVAGTFTKNVVKAAPVLWDKEFVEQKRMAHAVVVNAGIANACTGKEGYDCCKAVAKETEKLLKLPENSVLLGSTGVIGMQLPVEKMCQGIQKLAENLSSDIKGGTLAAEAIMTTDTRKKEIAFEVEIGGKKVTVAGMCKGSGMIHPNMCTLLAYVTSDVAISQELLLKALQEDVKDTYNMVSIDGDTSTNDTCLLLANGMAENPEITKEDADYQKFCKALHAVNTYLAKQMAGDGEGATALFEVKVTKAKTREEAVVLSKSVVSSNLVKTAIAGHDANWGRIYCALGYSGVDFDPEQVDLSFESKAGTIQITKQGVALNYSEEEAAKILSEEEITACIVMNSGEAEAVAWGCDLTHEYISINADYRS